VDVVISALDFVLFGSLGAAVLIALYFKIFSIAKKLGLNPPFPGNQSGVGGQIFNLDIAANNPAPPASPTIYTATAFRSPTRPATPPPTTTTSGAGWSAKPHPMAVAPPISTTPATTWWNLSTPTGIPPSSPMIAATGS
jgi:hypothetical protein